MRLVITGRCRSEIFFNLYCIVIQLIAIFLAKNILKHLAVNKKPTTFAPAIERDAVVKGSEGLKILKKDIQ